jgi:hypothetical protein
VESGAKEIPITVRPKQTTTFSIADQNPPKQQFRPDSGADAVCDSKCRQYESGEYGCGDRTWPVLCHTQARPADVT